jgi:hypothetical protein
MLLKKYALKNSLHKEQLVPKEGSVRGYFFLNSNLGIPQSVIAS